MRIGTVLIIIAALFAGVIAALTARTIIRSRSAPAAATAQSTIVVAAQPLEFGAPLTADNIIEVPWASSVIPDGAFTSAADLLKDGRRVVLTPVQKNEPILVSRITGSGQRASLSALIDAGMRAVTLRVDDVRGVAGFVLPGDRVDLVLTRHEGEKSFADVLLQNVKVLAVDQLTNERQEGPAVAKAVTVEVSTEQAQKLILAAGVGSLSLVLRQAGGADPVAARRVSTLDLAQGEYVGMDQEKTNLLQQKLSALEAKMDSELKRLATPPAASPAGENQPAGMSQTSMVRIIRGVRSEEYSVYHQAQ
ncbi:MAG: Flp pilus assembly protein CpaB [Rhodoblastus sp.]|uniref:Flp pilus assembly protein CpaB n=1 Tax=Rhodoblastus sp. TaxID=1962975 RepID=UPI003F9E1E11